MEFGSEFFYVWKGQPDVETVADDAPSSTTAGRDGVVTTVPSGTSSPAVVRSIKMVVVGDGGVGKSAITLQFVQKIFTTEYDPTIENAYRKAISVDGETWVLDILDTAGQEEFSAMRDAYFRMGQAFVVAYSVTDRESFESAKCILEHIRRMKEVTDATTSASFLAVLVGNKCDLLDRVVSAVEGEAVAHTWHIPFLETSAKTGANIDNLFITAAREIKIRTAPPTSAPVARPTNTSFFSKLFSSISPSLPPSAATPSHPTKTRQIEVAPTNIVLISLGDLSTPAELITGEPTFCACGAILTSASLLQRSGSYVSGWKCQFCNADNAVSLVSEQIPKSPSVDFILAPPPPVVADSLVVFVVDISGSMCVTTEVPDLQAEWQKLRMGPKKIIEGETGNYVTRLQCVKAAVDSHFQRLQKGHPNKKVALITFNSEVTIYGDGTSAEVIISGDKLDNFEEIWEIGLHLNPFELLPISRSREFLSKRVISLEEDGSTALGPALVAALGICSQMKSQSEIIVMTDGLSNVGVGILEMENEAEKAQAITLYKKLGTKAVQCNTTINIIGLEGKDSGHGQGADSASCDIALEILGSCAEVTHGTINIINPLELLRQIRLIYQNPVISTDVKFSFALPSGLEVVDTEYNSAPLVAYSSPATERVEDETQAEVMEMISQLALKKKAALEAEDYEMAQRIKSDLALCEELKQINASKKKAFEANDFLQANYLQSVFDQKKSTILTISSSPRTSTSTSCATATSRPASKPPISGLRQQIIGNANAEMDLTYQLEAKIRGNPALRDSFPSSIPVQAQIMYTTLDGQKNLRVITQNWRTTKTRSASEESINVAIVGLHALHQSARIASNKEYKVARAVIFSTLQLLKRVSKTEIQIEEHYSTARECEPFDIQLGLAIENPKSASSDTTAKMLNKYKSAPKGLLLASKLNTAAVKRRQVSSGMREDVSHFGVESRY
ncbi:Ras subfamily protein [Pelomyxa schiedti]|nr:Ras subfamily protein [Pelomyxa schiedti]